MPKSAIFAWPGAGQHDVGRLDVAMHDAALVAELQAGQQVLHDADRVGEREALLLVEQRLQRRAVDELHHDVGEVVGLAVVEHADDVGMRQPSGGLRLAAEPRQRLLGFRIGVVGQLDGLDRHAARDDRIPALVHDAHRAAAKRPLDLVLAEGLDGLHAAFRQASWRRLIDRRGAAVKRGCRRCAGARSPPSPITANGAQKNGCAISAGRPLPASASMASCASRSAPATPRFGFSRIRRSVSATRNAAT